MTTLRAPRSMFFPTPARVTALYLAISVAWIIWSDKIAARYFSVEALTFVQSVKGLFFVSLSSGVMFILLAVAHRAYAAMQSSAKAATAEIESIDADLKSALEIRGAILEMLPLMITVLDQRGVITACNRAWRSFCVDLGNPAPNYSVGRKYMDALSPVALATEADRQLVEEALEAILRQSCDTFRMDFPVTNERGRTRWYEMRLQGIAAGAERGVIIVHIDITDRKTREASLVLSEARFNALAWSAPCGIVIVRGDTILLANDKARALLGMPSETATLEPLRAYLRREPDGRSGQAVCGRDGRAVELIVQEREIPWPEGAARLMFLSEAMGGAPRDLLAAPPAARA